MSSLRFPVRVRPGASRVTVGGAYDGSRGKALVVAVTAPAVAGRATEAVLRAVAEALGARRGAVSLVTGAGSRDKLLAVESAPADLADLRADLDALLDSAPDRAGRPRSTGRAARVRGRAPDA